MNSLCLDLVLDILDYLELKDTRSVISLSHRFFDQLNTTRRVSSSYVSVPLHMNRFKRVNVTHGTRTSYDIIRRQTASEEEKHTLLRHVSGTKRVIPYIHDHSFMWLMSKPCAHSLDIKNISTILYCRRLCGQPRFTIETLTFKSSGISRLATT